MYHVQIGNIDIHDGDNIRENNLNSYNILWNTSSSLNELYTLLITDEGEVTPHCSNVEERIHLFLANISQGGDFDQVVDFIPINNTLFNKPHRFRIDLFWQSSRIDLPSKDVIQHFHLGDFLQKFRCEGKTLLLEDTLHFQIQPLELAYAPSPPRRKRKYPLFNERYNLDKLTKDDIRLIGDVYCIDDTEVKTIPEILSFIEKTLKKSKGSKEISA